MDIPSFAPRQASTADNISQILFGWSRGLLVVAIGTLPLLFVPGFLGLTGTVKIAAVLAVAVVATIVASLGILRHGQVTLKPAPLLLSWWGLTLLALVAALFSDNPTVGLWGQGLESHTVAFLGLGAVLMTLMQLFKGSKTAVVYLYSGLFISALVISVLHIARLLFGADVFSFGLLSSPAATLLGSFNDLALFLALVVMVGLVSLLELALPRLINYLLAAIMLLSTVMLTIINFFAVWLILGLFSLVLLMYALTKGRFGSSGVVSKSSPSAIVTLMAALIFIVSTIFVIGGSALGATVSKWTGVSYLEVRPSPSATLDIMRDVYASDALTGIGPNQFGDAWTNHKDSSINQTAFWNVTFNAGSGYVPTWFITGGLLAVVSWFVFLGLLLWSGVQALLKNTNSDPFWYFIGVVSYLSSLFVWGVSWLYVPGAVIIILGFISTGLFIVAHQVLSPRYVPTINLLASARTGFVLIVAVMIVILGAITVGYSGFRHIAATKVYTDAQMLATSGAAIEEVASTVSRAYKLAPTDVFARELANYYLTRLQQLLNQAEPSEATINEIKSLPAAALEAASGAISTRSGDARNWSTRADIFAFLASLNTEGAAARAVADYKEAIGRDPQNPYYHLQLAIMAIRANNEGEARSYLQTALALKPNYTDAIFVLSQLEISTGKLAQAIVATEALINLEPNNAGRYYQLGVLESANNNDTRAIAAFSEALVKNPNYANARYLRALQYLKTGNKDLALSELRLVRDMNEGNQVVDEMIGKIERGEVTADTLMNNQTAVVESEPVINNEENVITTDSTPDTDMLSPVNIPAVSEEEVNSTSDGE